jgi:MoaA/NifB/PqqE/SkfB family radical SAM enzyme
VARLLVVHPPVSVARDFIDYPYVADLGAVQLAAVLRARGYDVGLVDAYALPGSTLAWRPDGRAHLGAPVDEVVARATAGGWDAVVVAYTPFHRPPARDDVLGALLAALHGRAHIILADLYQSGQHYVEASAEDVRASYPEAAAWVKYEGEVSIPRLLERLFQGDSVAGGHRGADVASLDDLPLPAWDLVDLPAYDAFHARVVENLGRGAWAFPIDGRTLPLVTSRGCPFRCAHCSSNPGREPGAPKTQRRLSVARLREHLEALVRVHGATRVEVLDELLNVNERHFDAFLEIAASLGVSFDVPNGMRADYLEPRHLAAMRGRVTTVSVSAESGVQRVVSDVVGKQLDLRAIERAAASAHDADVPLMVHFMIGLPGETAEEINGTLAFASSLFARHGARPAVQFATPLPGTALAGALIDGRALPLVEDWGPHFQTIPTPLSAVGRDDLLRFKASFDGWMRAAEAPPAATLNVTYACNDDCSFCAVGPRAGLGGHATGLRGELDRLRREGVTALDVDGGEPTLHPELLALLRHARATGFTRIAVTTNGRMCFYEEYARKLVASGLTRLVFSVHGDDDATHARHVNVADAFEQTVGGIRNAVRLAPPGVELAMSTTVTRHNVARLVAIGALARSLGLARWKIVHLAPFGAGTAALLADEREALDATRAAIDGHTGALDVEVHNVPPCLLPGLERFVAPDPGRSGARRLVPDAGRVPLAAYVADQRVRRPVCASCPHSVACGGFLDAARAPDPPWTSPVRS